MSGIILANRERYLALVRELLGKRMRAEDFGQAFLAERRQDLVKEDQIAEQWPRRYDIELIEEHSAARLSAEDFSTRWHTLWGYPKDSPFIAFFERLFWVIEDYEPDRELFEAGKSMNDNWFHDEDEFRRRVAVLLAELEREERSRDS